MEKTIVIDGKNVKFKATAATLRIYRMKFQRDLMVDLAKLTMGLKANNNNFNIIDLEVFENVAYVMAKQAEIKDVKVLVELSLIDYYCWLSDYETQAFMDSEVIGKVIGLWAGNANDSHIESKN